MSTLELLKVVNTGDKPLILRHDGKGDVTIDPGRHRILPAEYAYLSFGDPRAVNAGKDKARDVEFKNCQTTWGFYPGLMSEAAWDGVGVDTTNGEPVGPFKPSYEVYDMDDERVYLVADDPDGTRAAEMTGVPTTSQSDNVELAALRQQLEAQSRQIADLTRAVLMQQTGVSQPEFDEDDDEPEDPDDDDLDDEDDDEEPEQLPEEPVTPEAKKAAAKPTKTTARKTTAAKKAAAKSDGTIPSPPADEPPVTADSPKVTRVGGR